MAEAKITDIIVPEVFTEYTMEPSIYKSRFFNAGILEPSQVINNLLAGGGETFNIPFWKDVTLGAEIPSETVAVTTDNITTDKQIGLRQFRVQAWGANNISGILAGANPLQALSDRVSSFWAYEFDTALINTLVGVKADDVANDSSAISNVTATQFNEDGVYDAQGKLGENATTSASDLTGGGFVGIAVHPAVYTLIRKQNMIDTIAISDQGQPVETYLGMRIIVDKNLPEAAGVYTSIIFKSGAVKFGQSTVGYLPTEVDRDPTKGMGIYTLHSRRVFTIHPEGLAWQDSSVAGLSPTNAELATAANWSKVYNAENLGFVFYDAKLS